MNKSSSTIVDAQSISTMRLEQHVSFEEATFADAVHERVTELVSSVRVKTRAQELFQRPGIDSVDCIHSIDDQFCICSSLAQRLISTAKKGLARPG